MADASAHDDNLVSDPSADSTNLQGVSTLSSAKPAKAKFIDQILNDHEKRQLDAEARHRESCGRQVNARKPTNPNFSFGSPRRLTGEREVRAREICEHPGIHTPGPNYFVEFKPSPIAIPVGWAYEKRWQDQGGPMKRAAGTITGGTGLNLSSSLGSDATLDYRGSSPMSPATFDYNRTQHRQPVWSMGTSGLGARFHAGTKFSRPAPVTTTSRLQGFRELRESIPQPAIPGMRSFGKEQPKSARA
mmetsp:Transcript_58031/g.138126  ORF Transcript_58031/g.138126 Transcript_58031/m.138126 type:complete len:246 (-) Transcript_58031:134-871(-)